MAYDPNVDYSLLIQQAQARGDTAAATQYAIQRLEKINATPSLSQYANDQYSQLAKAATPKPVATTPTPAPAPAPVQTTVSPQNMTSQQMIATMKAQNQAAATGTGFVPPASIITPAPYSNIDYAAEIIKELQSANPDQTRIAQLAKERDLKMSSDPSKYSGVISTQDLITQYSPVKTPTAPVAKTMTDVMPNPDGTYTVMFSDGTSEIRGQAKQVMQSNPQIDSLIATLQNLVNSSGIQPVGSMSYDTAASQAANELNPTYDKLLQDLIGATDTDLERRGLFSTTTGAGIVAEKSGALRAAQASDVAKRASELQSTSQQQALQQQQLYLQERSQRMDALSQLINTLSNRELGEAELTGVLRGVSTLQAQQAAADMAYKQSQLKLQEANLTGTYNGQQTLEGQKFVADEKYRVGQQALQEAQLTGVYNNNPTLAARAQSLNEWSTQFEAAVTRVNQLGRVTTQADAQLLGVPVGTQTWEAKNAIANRSAQYALAAQSIKAEAEQAALDRASRERMSAAEIAASQAQSAKDDAYKNFTKDLQIWELTGVAPNTPAMQAYGVTPGTVWTGTVKDQAAALAAQTTINNAADDAAFSQKVSQLQTVLGLPDENTAEAAAALFENTSRASAFSKFETNKEALKSEGVDLNALTVALNIRYPDSERWSLPSTSDYNNPQYIDGNLTTNTTAVAKYGNEIKSFLDQTSNFAAHGDVKALQVLKAFYNKFPAGAGNLADKVGFVRSVGTSNRTTYFK